jgi:hypothetical protein
MDSELKERISLGLRLLVSEFPKPGINALVQAWSEWESNKRFERVDQLFREFLEIAKEHANEIESLKNDTAKQMEASAILERVADYVQSEPSGTKRRILSSSFAHAIFISDGATYDEKVTLLDTVNWLTEQDLRILSLFTDENPVRQVGHMDENLMGDFASREKDFEQRINPWIVSLSKLMSRGLVSETETYQGEHFPYSGNHNHWLQVWRRKTFAITPFGRTLIQSMNFH